YYPLVESVRAGGRALSRIVNKIFHGSAESLLATLVEDRKFTAEEIARMRAILDRAERRRDAE
ncbi:MAG: BlaI/MecI/CopY family transcriptional regulator, partial [Gemmatimonadetes bacterium]|nr:BlaI/MecI/CopY family transcriptional regulator [Gemmatimonadota bacterium]